MSLPDEIRSCRLLPGVTPLADEFLRLAEAAQCGSVTEVDQSILERLEAFTTTPSEETDTDE